MACSCQEEYNIFLFKLTCEEVACTYYQAVDEFGCSSFKSGQTRSCDCPDDKKANERKKLALAEEPASKFGPVDPVMRSTIICEVPFEPVCDESVASLLLFSIPLLAVGLFV